MTELYKNAYDKAYFQGRVGNDPKRQAMFSLEAARIKQFVNKGNILDVGCSTGEFLESLNWVGNKYGMEISDHAVSIATEKGIIFEENIMNSVDFFDCIVFRGSVQHIDTPFLYIKKAFMSLKPGGYITFLASPNASSIYFKLFGTLPFIDQSPNFYIPSEKTLANSLRHFGFEICSIVFPYINTPYAQPVKDHLKFMMNFFFRAKYKHAFWGSSMEVYARKPL